MQIVNDISFWQDTADFGKMSLLSKGVILRAGQGSWQDKRFTKFRTDSEPYLPFGSYWYYDNNHAPKRQAELYASIIGDKPGAMGAWLDLEDPRPAPYENYKHWFDFCEYFKQLLPNVRLGIYTRASYFTVRVPQSVSYFSKYPLWVAHYNQTVTKPDLPRGWTDWELWQYTDSGDGRAHGVGSREIDMNRFHGTEEDFRARYNLPTSNKRHMTLDFQGKKAEYKEA